MIHKDLRDYIKLLPEECYLILEAIAGLLTRSVMVDGCVTNELMLPQQWYNIFIDKFGAIFEMPVFPDEEEFRLWMLEYPGAIERVKTYKVVSLEIKELKAVIPGDDIILVNRGT